MWKWGGGTPDPILVATSPVGPGAKPPQKVAKTHAPRISSKFVRAGCGDFASKSRSANFPEFRGNFPPGIPRARGRAEIPRNFPGKFPGARARGARGGGGGGRARRGVKSGTLLQEPLPAAAFFADQKIHLLKRPRTREIPPPPGAKFRQGYQRSRFRASFSHRKYFRRK